ncbi:Serpin-ZX [Capsicum annuum]|nr:Serpin-ZX [Capsicum annuum]
MTVAEYEAHFHKLARHATSILDTEYERVRCFVRGLRLPIRMATQSLVTAGRTFIEVANHSKVMKDVQRGCRDKWPKYQGRFGRSRVAPQKADGDPFISSRHPSKGSDQSMRGSYVSHARRGSYAGSAGYVGVVYEVLEVVTRALEVVLRQVGQVVIQADEVAAEINKWAEEKTNGLIKEILPPGTVDAGTRLVLGSALYFKGAWTEKLDASDTKDHEFHLLNIGVYDRAPFMTRLSVQVPFMTSKKWQYVKAYDGFKVLRLPYKQGEDKRSLSMYMFLPNDRDGLPALLEKISSEPGFLDQHVPLEEVSVRKFLIPKFKISFGIEFSKVLKGLGLALPFKGSLTEMVGNSFPLAVSKVFHKSFIKVNKEGTEAAAVTPFIMELD